MVAAPALLGEAPLNGVSLLAMFRCKHALVSFTVAFTVYWSEINYIKFYGGSSKEVIRRPNFKGLFRFRIWVWVGWHG